MCFQFVYTVQLDTVLYNSCLFLFLRHGIKKKNIFCTRGASLCFTQKIIFNEYIQTALILFIIKKLFFYFIFYHATLENIFGTLNNSVYIQNIVVWNESL